MIPMMVIGGFVFALTNLPITSDRFYEEYAMTLISALVLLIIGGLIITVFNFIMLFIMYLPILDTKDRRIVLFLK